MYPEDLDHAGTDRVGVLVSTVGVSVGGLVGIAEGSLLGGSEVVDKNPVGTVQT